MLKWVFIKIDNPKNVWFMTKNDCDDLGVPPSFEKPPREC